MQFKATTFAILLLISVSNSAEAQIAKNEAAESPWGAADEIGTLNRMSDASRLEILEDIASGKVYDLGVEMFVGMPACCDQFGDPSYQIWMTHAPARATGGPSQDELLSYSGDAVSMYTHTGTHIDALNHFGYHGRIWNRVRADDAIGERVWTRSGVDEYPPIIARGVLIDVAASKGVDRLPESYTITPQDLKDALARQRTSLEPGDVVTIRTGLMRGWPDPARYRIDEQPGIGLEAAQWLVDAQQAMLLGADNFGVESFPSTNPKNFVPVHSYLFAEKGVSVIEVMWLEELAKDRVYEFVFIAAPLKLRGATGSPIRPIAIPLDP